MACVMHTCAQSSGLGFETACVAAVAGVHGGASPANGVLGVLGLRIHKKLVPKDRTDRGVAHRGRGEADCAAQGGRRRGPGGARTKLGGVVEAGVVVGCSGPGDAPVVEAEPERSSAGAPVWRSGVAAVAQSRGTAEWGGAAAARFRGGDCEARCGRRRLGAV